MSNWCRVKLYDFSEKKVVPQYHSLTCVIPVKTLCFSTEITKEHTKKIPRLHPQFTCNVPTFSAIYACLNSCHLSNNVKILLYSSIQKQIWQLCGIIHAYYSEGLGFDPGVGQMLLLHFTNLHRNNLFKHEFKTRGVHDKCS